MSEEFALPLGENFKKLNELYHAFSYLGDTWGSGNTPRFGNDFVKGYTAEVVRRGGIVTWDVPHSDEGLINDNFMKQLLSVSETVKQLKND